MNCPNCGTNNLDNASVCVNCGRSLMSGPAQTYTPPPPPPAGNYGGGYAPTPATPPNNTAAIVYLILSILQLLCCCNPVALVPLIFAIMTISSRNSGDHAGAELNARRTALWFWISVGAYIIFCIVFFGLMGGMAYLEEIRRNSGQ